MQFKCEFCLYLTVTGLLFGYHYTWPLTHPHVSCILSDNPDLDYKVVAIIIASIMFPFKLVQFQIFHPSASQTEVMEHLKRILPLLGMSLQIMFHSDTAIALCLFT